MPHTFKDRLDELEPEKRKGEELFNKEILPNIVNMEPEKKCNHPDHIICEHCKPSFIGEPEKKDVNNQDEVRESIKEKMLKEIDFLSDHWVKGDDKPPFTFGGWREEVAEALVDIAQAHAATLLAKKREELKKLREVGSDGEPYVTWENILSILS